MVDANRKAQTLKSVMNNLNFAVESMSRNIRFGTTYHCEDTDTLPPPAALVNPRDCSTGGPILAFEPFDGDPDDVQDQVVYRLNGTQIERSVDSGATFIPITAPEVQIEEFHFYVDGARSSDTLQPRAVMVIRGSSGTTAKTRTEFTLQTSVTQRVLDL
jgi:hypothetical protein